MQENRAALKSEYSLHWLLHPARDFQKTVDFYTNVLGFRLLDQGYAQTDFHFNRYAQFQFENGITFEVVEPKEQYKDIFRHPIACLRVEDLEAHRKHLSDKGTVFISEILDSGDGWGWTYFKGADDTILQLEGPYKASKG